MANFFSRFLGIKSDPLIIEPINDDTQPRFSITLNGVKRKVFTYFQASGDGSIVFHTYLPGKYSGELKLGRDFANSTMNLDEMERSDDFYNPQDKLS